MCFLHFSGAAAPLPELQQALELSGGDADRAEAVVKLKAELGAAADGDPIRVSISMP